MTEYIEMEATTSSSSFQSKKVLKKEYEMRPYTDRSISHWWVILPVLFYLSVIVGGVMTSISVGNSFAAFDNYCIFNANFTLKNIESLGGNKTLQTDNVDVKYWGDKNDCLFTEYASVACVIFSGVWIVMVLQCGRGGSSRRGFRLPDAWRIVPPTLLGNTFCFIISCFVLTRASGGFVSFCDNIQFLPDFPATKNMSCSDILSFHFPWDKFKVNLVQEYRVSQIGAVIQFVGSLLGFLIITLRCCIGVDFELYERRQIAYLPANTEDLDPDELLENDTEESYSSTTSPATTTTVICHNPVLMVDEDDPEFGSLTSESGLISKPSTSHHHHHH